jgi:hypothetical protein
MDKNLIAIGSIIFNTTLIDNGLIIKPRLKLRFLVTRLLESYEIIKNGRTTGNY